MKNLKTLWIALSIFVVVVLVFVLMALSGIIDCSPEKEKGLKTFTLILDVSNVAENERTEDYDGKTQKVILAETEKLNLMDVLTELKTKGILDFSVEASPFDSSFYIVGFDGINGNYWVAIYCTECDNTNIEYGVEYYQPDGSEPIKLESAIVGASVLPIYSNHVYMLKYNVNGDW